MNNLTGRTIAQYRILEQVGQGGMGVVYKAEDLKLTRTVALKFLPPGLDAHEPERARFLQEARAAAILNHPNICTVYDIQEGEGQPFIVMEYIEGKTLRREIEDPRPTDRSNEGGRARLPGSRQEGWRGGLKIEDCIRYAIMIAEALQEAHSKGIVHRDIKAENIIVTTKNQIKVMDFGLAKLKGSLKLTRTSSTVGTLAYMAPEQIAGGDVDARSDIFSFGVVLFEMLTGRTPFRGEHEAAMMYSILNEAPLSLQEYRHDCPADLDRIIQRSLEKDREDRYQHVDDMLSELKRLHKQTSRVSRPAVVPPPAVDVRGRDFPGSSGTPTEMAAPGSRKLRVPLRAALIGGILLAGACVAVYFFLLRTPGGFDSLAVLPFVNVGGDANMEYLSDGIAESVINSLSRIPQLRVVPRTTVFRFKGKDVDPEDVGNKLNVKSVLTGRIIRNGDELNVQLDLIDVERQSQIWGNQYRRKIADVLTLQDEIVGEITSRLRLTLATETRQRLAKRPTDNVDAYQLYLQGEFCWNKRQGSEIAKAIEYFNRAIVLDPNYALAYVGLANCYILQEEYAGLPGRETYPKAEAAARKALEIDNTIAEAHATLGFVREYSRDWRGAEQEFKTAIALNPRFATSYQWYGILLRSLGHTDGYVEMIEKARQADPMSLIIATNVAESFYARGDYTQALSKYQAVLEIDSTYGIALDRLGMMYRKEGMPEKALACYRRAVNSSNRAVQYVADMGNCLARMGRTDEANAILKELRDRYDHHLAAAWNIAIVYAGLGDRQKALDWLERDVADQSGWILFLQTEEAFDNMRSDPRYVQIAKQVGLMPREG